MHTTQIDIIALFELGKLAVPALWRLQCVGSGLFSRGIPRAEMIYDGILHRTCLTVARGWRFYRDV